MLHAVLHNKLDETTPEPQRLEDAITSTVFGTLVLVDAGDVLATWLSQAKRVGGARERPHGRAINGVWFWPRLALAEPDVILRLGDQLFIIEAKFRSDRHDLPVTNEHGEEEEVRIADQLHRQWLSIRGSAASHTSYPSDLRAAIAACRASLIYVVDGRRARRARRQFAESVARLPREADAGLLTWQSLHEIIAATDFQHQSSRWSVALSEYLPQIGLEGFIGMASRAHHRSSDFEVARSWTIGSADRSDLSFRRSILAPPHGLAIAQEWLPNAGWLNGVGSCRRRLVIAHGHGIHPARSFVPALKWNVSSNNSEDQDG